MIVGDGLIAGACEAIDRDGVVFFASGVSYSKETLDSAFQREAALLSKYIADYPDSVFVYFGTSTGILTPYGKHKQQMCDMVSLQEKHIILRLSQVVGNGGNRNTLFNYLYSALCKGDEIEAYPEERSFIDVDDVIRIVDGLLNINVFGDHHLFRIDPMAIKDIILLMAKEIGVDANIRVTEGAIKTLPPNTELMCRYADKIKQGYTKRVIHKYVQHDHGSTACL